MFDLETCFVLDRKFRGLSACQSGFVTDQCCLPICCAGRHHVTPGFAGRKKKFSRRFRLLGRDLCKLIGVSITKNERRDLLFRRLRRNIVKIDMNRHARDFGILFIDGVDADIDAAIFPQPLGRFDA